MVDIDDVADYLIVQMADAGETLSVHRLHKLLYYIQGWHLAVHGVPLFTAQFEAWVHGPICRRLFDRFNGDRSLYCTVDRSDVREGFSFECLASNDREHADKVLDAYGAYPTFQLMSMSREERPWIEARGALPLAASCDNELSEATMRSFFLDQMETQDHAQVAAIGA